MTDFFVRVELHNATGADYDLLHARMVAAGFYRAIISGDGTKMRLPTAEYHAGLPDATTATQVRDAAVGIANLVKANPWVLAVKSGDWAIRSQAIS